MKFATGNPTDELWLSMQRVTGGASSFDTIGQLPACPTARRRVSARPTDGEADTAFLYFETRWPDGTTAPFLVDDVIVETQAPPVVEDLTPIKDTVDFGLGVAIDSRETAGLGRRAPAPPLRPADAREPHEARGVVRRRSRPSASIPRRRRSWTSPRRTGSRLRPHARLAQPDAGVVLQPDDGTPLTNGDADQAAPAPPAARPHLQRSPRR